MAFKQKGFPMHKSASALKQTQTSTAPLLQEKPPADKIAYINEAIANIKPLDGETAE